MYWFRVRHLSALPAGRCCLFGDGDLAIKLHQALLESRGDIQSIGLIGREETSGNLAAKLSGDCDYLIVPCEEGWQRIIYEELRELGRPFYVALPECLDTSSPSQQNQQAYLHASARDFVPTSFCLQLSSICNSRCTMCPKPPRVSNRYMPGELVTRILDEVAEIAPGANIYLSTGYGEPLLHDRLEGIVEWVVERGLNSILATNGILLDRKRIEALVSAGLRSVFVSFSGTTPDLYQRVYGNPHFHTVTQNIADACEVMGQKGLVGNIGCIFAEDNRDFYRQACDSYDLLRDLGMSENSINFGFPQNRGDLVRCAASEERERMHSVLDSFPPLTRPCHALSSLGITADGDVDLCYCASTSDAAVVTGNVHSSTLAELARSPVRVKALQSFRDEDFRDNDLCGRCDAPYLF